MRKKIKNTLIYYFLKTLIFVVSLIPLRLALKLGGWLGIGFYKLVALERNRALENLKRVFPELSEKERQERVRNTFIALGKNALELLKMLSYSTKKILSLVAQVQGKENMIAARAQGNGVLCLTAHLGNWEILPIWTHQQNWPTAVVAQVLYDKRLDMLLNQFRQAHGVTVIRRDQVTREIIRCLRGNMLLGILNDQDTDVDSRWAPFFGYPAKTPVGIFRLARKLNTPVVPVFIGRQADGRNHIYIDPELKLPHTQDEEQDILECALLANASIESFIRRFPDQWVWFHQRWKSQPPEPSGLENRK